MPNGSAQYVKFDGIEGEYLIDRKWTIVDRPCTRAQALRQSIALSEQCLIATWEVPNAVHLTRARSLLKRLGIRNIKVRVVEP